MEIIRLPTATIKEGKLDLDYKIPYAIPVHYIPICISCYEMEGIGVIMDATVIELYRHWRSQYLLAPW